MLLGASGHCLIWVLLTDGCIVLESASGGESPCGGSNTGAQGFVAVGQKVFVSNRGIR